MRKIKPKKDIEERKKKNAFYLGLVLVILLTLSTVGYSIVSRDDSETIENYVYNGIEFERSGGFWIAQIGGSLFYFMSLPEEISGVSIEGNFSFDKFINQPLYVVNPRDSSQLILGNLEPFVTRTQEACVEGLECSDETFPVKDCSSNVLIFTDEEKSVRAEENCIYISSDFESSDALMYELLELR